MVVVRDRTYVDDHPRLGARTNPAEVDGFEVFEGGEAEELVVHLVVRHDGESAVSVDAFGGDVNGNALDVSRTYLDPLFGVVVAFVRIEVEINAAFVGVVANVLHVIVDGDGVGVVDHYGL